MSKGYFSRLWASRRWRKAIIFTSLPVILIGAFLLWRGHPAPTVPAVLSHTYEEALEQAHNGKPGAARVLYQQLARTDLSDIRRASLLAELPNYPSTVAIKLLKVDLKNGSLLVRQAAIDATRNMLSGAQRSVLLGPLLEDGDAAVQLSATYALLGLSPDDLGVYFVALQKSVDASITQLKKQPPSVENLLQLARLLAQDGKPGPALEQLQQALTLEPGNLHVALAKVELLDQQGQPEQARQWLARLLEQQPHSAQLQHALGTWLLHHDQEEYALLALAKALELEPDNNDYRYDLAVALHDLDQLEPAQKQLAEILQRQPGNRQARLLLVHYWKESGQLQNVQVLLAELEQQNADDPALQQGL